MQSYCEVMGVKKASDLPAKHLPNDMGGESKPTAQIDTYSVLFDPLPSGTSNSAKTKEDSRWPESYKRGRFARDLPHQSVRMSSAADLSMEEFLTCEAYAGSLRAWLMGRGPFPNNRPPRYHIYRLNHPNAPDVPATPTVPTAFDQPTYHTGAYAGSTPGEGIAMSAGAFNTFLLHQQTTMNQVMALAKRAGVDDSARGAQSFFRGRGMAGRGARSARFDRRAGRLADRVQGGIRLQENGLPVPLGRGGHRRNRYRRERRQEQPVPIITPEDQESASALAEYYPIMNTLLTTDWITAAIARSAEAEASCMLMMQHLLVS